MYQLVIIFWQYQDKYHATKRNLIKSIQIDAIKMRKFLVVDLSGFDPRIVNFIVHCITLFANVVTYTTHTDTATTIRNLFRMYGLHTESIW